MSINPVQSFLPATALAEREPSKGSGASSFGTLLNALRTGKEGTRIEARQAAAEMLRTQMMQASLSLLSLADGAEAPQSTGSSPLAALLAGLAEINPSARRGSAMAASPAEVSSNVLPLGRDNGEIRRTASRFLGTPYIFGGEGPTGIDCSSFVQQVFREHQIALPRTAQEQSKVGRPVAPGELREGDLVFFRTYASYPSHVGIYLGEGKMIHASSHRGEVVVSDMNSDYYRSRFLGATRVT